MKKCSKCKVEKPATNEYFQMNKKARDGLRSDCKECRKKSTEQYRCRNEAKIKEQKRNYRNNNKVEIKKQQKNHYEANKEKIMKMHEVYRLNNKEEISKQRKKYKIINKDKINHYVSNKLKEDINFKLSKNIRNRMLIALKRNSKSDKTFNLLGCTIDQLKQHLESQFEEGMTWENHGLYGWHIDHIKPCASFDLSDSEQQRECFHYTNLQPLWAKDNLIKNGKMIN
jgi:hypothetical protein